MISRLSSSVTPESRDEATGRPTGGVVMDRALLLMLLGDHPRLRILDMLGARKELCVRDLWERLGQSQPAVSHHLGLLRMAGLVDTRHEGKHIYYRIHQERFDEMMGMMQQTQVGERLLSSGADSEAPQEMPADQSGSV